MNADLLLLVEIERHHMVLLQILYFPLLIDQLALLILQFLFCDNPVVVYTLSLFLEVSQ